MGPNGGTVTLTMTMILKQCLWECLTAAALDFTVEGEPSACSQRTVSADARLQSSPKCTAGLGDPLVLGAPPHRLSCDIILFCSQEHHCGDTRGHLECWRSVIC